MPTRILLRRGDITEMDVDAIVNSVNSDLILGAGVSGAIRRVGGPEIQEECNKIGTIPLGHAAITTGGKLPCRWIIHGAVLPLGLWADEKSVRNAMRNCLKLAEEKKVKSLAVPAIGAGAGAFPIERCADVVFQETFEHLKQPTSLEAIVFVLYDEKYLAAFQERFPKTFPDRDPLPLPPNLPRAYRSQDSLPSSPSSTLPSPSADHS